MCDKKQARITAGERVVPSSLGPLLESFWSPDRPLQGEHNSQFDHKARLLRGLAKAHDAWCRAQDDKQRREAVNFALIRLRGKSCRIEFSAARPSFTP